MGRKITFPAKESLTPLVSAITVVDQPLISADKRLPSLRKLRPRRRQWRTVDRWPAVQRGRKTTPLLAFPANGSPL